MIKTVNQLIGRLKNKKEGEVINWYKELRLNHTVNRKLAKEIAGEDQDLYNLLVNNPFIDKKICNSIRTYQELRIRCIELIDESEVINFRYECTVDLAYDLTEKQIISILELDLSDTNKRKFGKYISINPKLTERFIMKYHKYLNMPVIYSRLELSENAIEYLFKKHGYIQILRQTNLTINFIETMVKPKASSLRLLSENKTIDEFVIDHYFNELDKFSLSFRSYSKEFLYKYVDDLNVGALLLYNDLSGIVSEDIIREYYNRIGNCHSLSIYKNELYWDEVLSGRRDNPYGINTDYISRNVYLTKYLIDKYQDILNMELVKKYQLEYND